MIISTSTSGLKQSKWYEYLIRFALGGLVTAGAGAIAKKFGAELAGLFLAFPAILVASTSLVEKHEQERKQKKGLNGFYRGRQAAGADAAGAAIGSLGLMAFAALAWKFLPGYRPLLVIPGAGLLWALVAATVWWFWKRNFPRRLRAAVSGPFMRRR